MGVHHVVLRSPDPAGLAAFYAAAFDLPELRRRDDEQGLYSVWLDLGEGVILMVERGERPPRGGSGQGWDGLFLRAEPGTGPGWEQRWAELDLAVVGRTAATLYVLDPDGNRAGVSSFPDALG